MTSEMEAPFWSCNNLIEELRLCRFRRKNLELT